jgi:hypothetical protein
MNFPDQPIVIHNPFNTFVKQLDYLVSIAKVYGFRQSIPRINYEQQRSFNSKFNNYKIQLNEFTKHQDQLSVGCIDVLSGKGDYPDTDIHQKKEPKFRCEFKHELFV